MPNGVPNRNRHAPIGEGDCFVEVGISGSGSTIGLGGCFIPTGSLTGSQGVGSGGLGSSRRPRSHQTTHEDSAGSKAADAEPSADAFKEAGEEVVGGTGGLSEVEAPDHRGCSTGGVGLAEADGAAEQPAQKHGQEQATPYQHKT
jgi:hypothetical protein